MRDGRTRKLGRPAAKEGLPEFLADFEAKLVLVSGQAVGSEYPVERERLTLGRGPGVDLAFHDSSMSRQHAAVEFVGGGFRVRDLGSTNGILVNGEPVEAGDIEDGDRFEIGEQAFQLVIQERAAAPEVYELPEG